MEDYPSTFQNGKLITLEGPSGNKWRVAAVDRSVLHLGWRAFAHDHRLREGDVLNFNLKKPSHFVVDIYNSHGDVRRSARNARVTGKYSIAPGTPALQDRSRKRKEMETGELTIADQCKATAKRGNVDYTMGPRLKFCEKTKQWKSHEEREVVNLDSDDEEPRTQAVTRRQTSSKIERLVEFMREEENGIQVINLDGEDHQVVKRTHVSSDGEEDYVAHEQQEDDDSLDEEKDIASNPLRQFTTMFDTRPRKTTEDLKAEKPAIEVKKEALDRQSDPLSRQAQITSWDEDMVIEEQEETHLARIVHSDNVEDILHSPAEAAQFKRASESHNNAASDKVLESHKINPIAQAAADYEPVTNKADTHSNPSPVTLPASTSEMYELSTLNSMAKDAKIATVNSSRLQGKVQEAGESMSNDVNIHVTDTKNEGQHDSVHPLSQELAKELDTLKLNEDAFLTNSIDTPHEESMFQPTPTSTALNELHVAKMEPGNNSTAMTSSVLTPAATDEIGLQVKTGNEADVVKKQMVGLPQRKLEFKELSANISHLDAAQVTDKSFNIQAKPTPILKNDPCVLISKRSIVTQIERDRALHSARAWGKKLHNPYFITVMKNTHVYTDFNMVKTTNHSFRKLHVVLLSFDKNSEQALDIQWCWMQGLPAQFVKQAKLPATEVRVTLVCDSPPSNCKAIWEPGNNMKNSKLNAQGWMKFSRTHFLEEGDVCVFEDLNKIPTIRIGVYIFRVVELKRPTIFDWERHYKAPKS
jgi:hypothetical protein